MKLPQSPGTLRKNNRKNVRKTTSTVQKPNRLQTAFNQVNWSKIKYQIVAGLFATVWAVLWLRAAYLQVIIGSDLRDKSARQHSITQLVEAKRGNIYDRNGQILARSVEVKSVYAHPQNIVDTVHAAKVLAPILDLTQEQVLKQLEQKKSFVWLKRKIDDASSLAIQTSGIAGIGLSKEYERVYPYKHLAGQLLGFVGLDNDGLEGVERAFNDILTGTSQKQLVPRNLAGRALYSPDDDETEGTDIDLTLDVQIQFIAEEVIAEAVQAYDAKWGGVLVADPQSGDILAWAQYPFFNPNSFRSYDPAIYRNRLANDALEPGSTFKPLVVAVALEEQIINAQTEFFCENGSWQIDSINPTTKQRFFTIGDDGRSYKNLNPEEILAHSSNIGMAKIAKAIGSEKLKSYLQRLGFGKTTNLGLDESRGILRRLRDWSEADLLSTGFGQSISVTGLQLLQAYNILVNDGENVSLNLRKDENNNNSNVSEKSIFSRKVSREVLSMMESVVDGNGTGKRARIEGVRVAGKTGTAQKAAKRSTGYGEDRMASFVGIIPADNPRYIIITILDEPKKKTYGGVIAAPVFQKVAVRTMAYSGDLPGVVFPQEPSGKNSAKAKQKTKVISLENGLMPDLTNLSLRSAMNTFKKLGIIPKVVGEGTHIASQSPAAGTPLGNALTTQKKPDDKKSKDKEQDKDKKAQEKNNTKNKNTIAVNGEANTTNKGNTGTDINTKAPQSPQKAPEFILYLATPQELANQNIDPNSSDENATTNKNQNTNKGVQDTKDKQGSSNTVK